MVKSSVCEQSGGNSRTKKSSQIPTLNFEECFFSCLFWSAKNWLTATISTNEIQGLLNWDWELQNVARQARAGCICKLKSDWLLESNRDNLSQWNSCTSLLRLRVECCFQLTIFLTFRVLEAPVFVDQPRLPDVTAKTPNTVKKSPSWRTLFDIGLNNSNATSKNR